MGNKASNFSSLLSTIMFNSIKTWLDIHIYGGVIEID